MPHQKISIPEIGILRNCQDNCRKIELSSVNCIPLKYWVPMYSSTKRKTKAKQMRCNMCGEIFLWVWRLRDLCSRVYSVLYDLNYTFSSKLYPSPLFLFWIWTQQLEKPKYPIDKKDKWKKNVSWILVVWSKNNIEFI